MRLRGFRQSVDDLIGARVMQAFPGFVFNRAGVRFKPVHMLAEPRVLFRKAINLLRQSFIFDALLLPTVEAVAAIDDVPSQKESKNDRGYRADATPTRQILQPQTPEERGGRCRGGRGL